MRVAKQGCFLVLGASEDVLADARRQGSRHTPARAESAPRMATDGSRVRERDRSSHNTTTTTDRSHCTLYLAARCIVRKYVAEMLFTATALLGRSGLLQRSWKGERPPARPQRLQANCAPEAASARMRQEIAAIDRREHTREVLRLLEGQSHRGLAR